jgi:hypothetical protein
VARVRIWFIPNKNIMGRNIRKKVIIKERARIRKLTSMNAVIDQI